MTQDKTIKGVMERFRETFFEKDAHPSHPDVLHYVAGEDIIDFFEQEIKLALESQKEEILKLLDGKKEVYGNIYNSILIGKEKDESDSEWNEAINYVINKIKEL